MRTAACRVPRYLLACLAHPAMAALLLLVVLSGYLLSYNVDRPTHNGDWYIRYQVTCSIVERNAFSLTPYDASKRTGAGVDGHTYAQYTLGQTTALIPFYLLGRVLAGVAHTDCATRIANPIVLLTCKLLDPILGALLCALFYATARLLGYAPRIALTLTLLLAFGTALWPDVLSNLEHTQESLFLLCAAYAALRYTLARRKSRLWVLVLGLAAGLVFVTRIAGLIAPPIFALYLLLLHRRWRPHGWRGPFLRDGALFALGVAPSIVVNGIYDALRFGSPLRTGPYPDQSFGYPPWLGIPNLLISPGKGLLWYTPAVFLLLLGAWPFWRRFPLPARLFGLICGAYLLFYANVMYWHGDPAWGPRYLYAVLPYLMLPLGEVWQRWRSYRPAARSLIVGVLAASFLVQCSAVAVSYWRHWYLIYGYHHDQVEDHGWGSNMNYWWKPDQSPIVVSLAGIYDVTQAYVDHAPLLWHAADQRLADPRESSTFRVYGQAAIHLTYVDKLHDMGNWNTFSPWWLHVYPWWSQQTIIGLTFALVVVLVASGSLLLAILLLAAHQTRAPPPATRPGYGVPHAENRTAGNGQSRTIGVLPISVRTPERATSPTPASVGGSALALAARPGPEVAMQPRGGPGTPPAGLLPLGLAALVAALVYGAIVGAAAMRAPRSAPPLIHTVAMDTTVRDGPWAYRVLGVTSLPALPDGIAPPVDAAHHYVIVRLRLHNYLSRPQSLPPESFGLTGPGELRYPLRSDLRTQVAELYHLAPIGSVVPARSVMDGALIFEVRNSARNFELLGPGIALVRLTQ
jgi:hypothetical protein